MRVLDPDDPAVLLIDGAAASMLWWDAGLCARIAACGRFVIRYDQRDTGRSTAYPPGRPGYSNTDLARDAIGILDALTISRAHVVCRSMSGGLGLILGVDHPSRVATLTFVPFILNGAITTLTSLDFLGFGLPPGAPSLGEILAQGKANLQAPWLGLTGFLVLAVMLSLLVFIGEAVRDAFDPRKVQ